MGQELCSIPPALASLLAPELRNENANVVILKINVDAAHSNTTGY